MITCKWCPPDNPKACYNCRKKEYDKWLQYMAWRSFFLILFVVFIVIGVILIGGKK